MTENRTFAFIKSDKKLIKLFKYNRDHNSPYSYGIIQEKHVAKTMEFIILD